MGKNNAFRYFIFISLFCLAFNSIFSKKPFGRKKTRKISPGKVVEPEESKGIGDREWTKRRMKETEQELELTASVQRMRGESGGKLPEEEDAAERRGFLIKKGIPDMDRSFVDIVSKTRRKRKLAKETEGEKKLRLRYEEFDKEIADSRKKEMKASGAVSKTFSDLQDQVRKGKDVRGKVEAFFVSEEYDKLRNAHEDSSEELKKMVKEKDADLFEYDESLNKWTKALTVDELTRELKNVDEFGDKKREIIKKAIEEELSKKQDRDNKILSMETPYEISKELERLNRKPVKTFNDWEDIKKLRKRFDKIEEIKLKAIAEEAIAIKDEKREPKKRRARDIIAKTGASKEMLAYAQAGSRAQELRLTLDKLPGAIKQLEKSKTNLNDIIRKNEDAISLAKEKLESGSFSEEKEKAFNDRVQKLTVSIEKRKKELEGVEEQLKDLSDAEKKTKREVKISEENIKVARSNVENILRDFGLSKKQVRTVFKDAFAIKPERKTKRVKQFVSKHKKGILGSGGLILAGSGAAVVGGLGLAGGAVAGTGLAAGTTMLSGQDEIVATEEAEYEEPEPYDFSDYDFDAYYDEFAGEY